ncbi:MAG: hypothetical protein BGO67_06120 [Alphaproteobacteria bacterium 41-28]|nr:MAG: hypothetical protein BGO67_06120 [Alphaproteobacteria bacterium 41-28]
MKLLIMTAGILILATAVKANDLSSCQSACFASKQSCNAQKSHSFNTCDRELFACKASCESGKPQRTYEASLVDISFQPILRP